ncbi:hypothetical protein ANO11243_000110 [Dothideomycetidae sp. 11243]|nr:hypothetical protein ANO11243_000110 [fungal sp. No.11243]
MARRSAKAAAEETPKDSSARLNGSKSDDKAEPSTPRGQKRKRLGANEGASDSTPIKQEEHEAKSNVTNGTTRSPRRKATKQSEAAISPPRSSRQRKTVKYNEDSGSDPEGLAPPAVKHEQPEPARAVKKVKVEVEIEAHTTPSGDKIVTQTTTTTTTKRPRKSKAEKEAEAMPLAARTAGHRFVLGAHVSAAGGVDKAVNNAVHIGANSFALFLKSQRKWANPPLEDGTASLFQAHCKHHDFAAGKHVVPHGSYLVNLAHTDPTRTEQAYGAFIDDLKRCERLGIGLYNFHPGNVQGVSRKEAIAHLAKNLNRAHRETKSVVTLLENMAAGGNVLGSTFEDLADTIALVEDKSRIGVCLDTCHAFAAGYDLRNKDAINQTLEKLDHIVGLKYLRALHLNDSKAPFDSRRDLHANIGTGFLGLRAFHGIMNDSRFEGLPIVLETPIEVYDDEGNPVKDDKGKDTKEDRGIWAREIKMLEGLHGMDVESKEFRELEETLAARGQKERARVQDQVDRRVEKANSKSKGTKKGKKQKDDNTSDEDSE